MNSIGDRIRSSRMAGKMSMQELADVLGKSKGNISEYEKGKYEPSAQTVIALSRVFHVSADWLLTGEEYNPKAGPAAPGNLSDTETQLLAMFRLLDERDKADVYDNVYCKYKRGHEYCDRVAESEGEYKA